MTDRTVPPVSGRIRPYEFPAVARERLGNGMEVCVVPATSLPIVTAMVVLPAGETVVPAQQAGLAVLSGDALEGGTERLTSRELAAALEGVGASFGAATGWDSTTVAVACQADVLTDAMPLLAQMVCSPAFEKSEFDRYRAQRLATAARRQMNPSAIAADAHARYVFAGGDTYARPLGGTEASVGTLEAGDARDFVAARYGPAAAAVVLVGDLGTDQAMEIADREFGDWVRAAGAVPGPSASPRQRDRAVHVVHRPGSVQSQIRVGHVGVPRAVEDYFPLIVLNLVLGGSFSSRLNLNLRERHGFTYGVRSTFSPRRGPGPFSVSTSVENAVTGAAIAEIFAEIETLVEGGPTSEEVATATSYLAGVFPLRMETTGQIASRIAEMFVYGLPEDYYRNYRDRVREVTREDAALAARSHIRPAELCTVVVGDAEAVAPQLEAFEIGPVSVHGADR